MATLNTTDDLLRLVREDSEFRAAMRRELLTAELLEVPNRLTMLEQGIAALLEHAKATNRRLDSLDSIEEDIKQIKINIDGLGASFRDEVKAQSSYRGAHAQTAAYKDNRDIAWLFASKHGLRRVKTHRVSSSRLEDWLTDNTEIVEALNLRERAWRTFPQPDIIAEVRDLKAARDAAPAYYIAVEASYTVEKEDIVKATDHAKIVHAVTGLSAYAVVAGVNMDDEMDKETQSRLYSDVERFVDANDMDAAYWYRLDSADLRPPEPR